MFCFVFLSDLSKLPQGINSILTNEKVSMRTSSHKQVNLLHQVLACTAERQ